MASVHTDGTSDENEDNYDKMQGDSSRKAVRRLKNRESARRVRARRVLEVQELQSQISTLTTENAGLRTCLAQMQGHMQAMVERVHELTSKYEAVTMDNMRLKRFVPGASADSAPAAALAGRQDCTVKPDPTLTEPTAFCTALSQAAAAPPVLPSWGDAVQGGNNKNNSAGQDGSAHAFAGMGGGGMMAFGASPQTAAGGTGGDLSTPGGGVQPELSRLLERVAQQRQRRKHRDTSGGASGGVESSQRSMSDHMSADVFSQAYTKSTSGATTTHSVFGSSSLGGSSVAEHMLLPQFAMPAGDAVAAAALAMQRDAQQQQQLCGAILQQHQQYNVASGGGTAVAAGMPQQQSLVVPLVGQRPLFPLGTTPAQEAPTGTVAGHGADATAANMSTSTCPAAHLLWPRMTLPAQDWGQPTGQLAGHLSGAATSSMQQYGGRSADNNVVSHHQASAGHLLSSGGTLRHTSGAVAAGGINSNPSGIEPATLGMMLRQHQHQQHQQLDLLHQAAQWQQQQQASHQSHRHHSGPNVLSGQYSTGQYSGAFPLVHQQHQQQHHSGPNVLSGGDTVNKNSNNPMLSAPANVVSSAMLSGTNMAAADNNSNVHGAAAPAYARLIGGDADDHLINPNHHHHDTNNLLSSHHQNVATKHAIVDDAAGSLFDEWQFGGFDLIGHVPRHEPAPTSCTQQHAQAHAALLRRHSMGHGFCNILASGEALQASLHAAVQQSAGQLAGQQQHYSDAMAVKGQGACSGGQYDFAGLNAGGTSDVQATYLERAHSAACSSHVKQEDNKARGAHTAEYDTASDMQL